MWPFMVAGAITVYYVAKIQDMAVRCVCSHILATIIAHFPLLAPEYAKDPKNPFATQISNSSAH